MVNPWFVGIQSDHETTDIPESGNWSTIASYHGGMEAPKTTPSGQSNSHGYPLKRFPTSLPLRHISHISDAFVGLTRWDDPMVKRELAVLLGPSDTASRKLVKKCRKRMIRAYKANMVIIPELEIKLYGENSYYRLIESGRYRAPRFEGDCALGDEPAEGESGEQLDEEME